MPALRSEVRTAVDPTSTQRSVARVSGGFAIPGRGGEHPRRTLYSIPLRPVWPGFVVNSAFYGVIAWVVLRGVRVAWRHRGAMSGDDRRRAVRHVAFVLVVGAADTYISAGVLVLVGPDVDVTGRREDFSLRPPRPANVGREVQWLWRITRSEARGLARWHSLCERSDTYVNYAKWVPTLEDDDLPAWLIDALPQREREYLERAAAAAATSTALPERYPYFGTYTDEFAGWPLLALGARTFDGSGFGAGADVREAHWGLSVPRRANTRSSWERLGVIPLRPVWPGFVVDTGFYGGAAWLVFLLPRTVRRGLRRRGNRCVRCGYDRRGIDDAAACPECGAPSV